MTTPSFDHSILPYPYVYDRANAVTYALIQAPHSTSQNTLPKLVVPVVSVPAVPVSLSSYPLTSSRYIEPQSQSQSQSQSARIYGVQYAPVNSSYLAQRGRKSKSPSVNVSYHLPGYGGHVQNYAFKFGRSYGKITAEVLRDSPHGRPQSF